MKRFLVLLALALVAGCGGLPPEAPIGSISQAIQPTPALTAVQIDLTDPSMHYIFELVAPPIDPTIMEGMEIGVDSYVNPASVYGNPIIAALWHEEPPYTLASQARVHWCAVYSPQFLPANPGELIHPRNSPPNFTGPANTNHAWFVEVWSPVAIPGAILVYRG